MSVIPLEQTLRDIAQGLRRLGYRDELVKADYEFADILSRNNPLRQVPLAAFGHRPLSYRTACIALVEGRTENPEWLMPYRALGAPQMFLSHSGNISRWKMTAKGEPEFLDRVPLDHFLSSLEQHRDEWSPSAVMRTKAPFQVDPVQLDFYDAGLIPEIDSVVKTKLHQLLEKTIAASSAVLAEHHLDGNSHEDLFRLVFRLLSAKLLGDRGHAGPWDSADSTRVISAIEQHYFRSGKNDFRIDQEVQQVAWNQIRDGFHLQNVSVETLAHIYENTAISPGMRRRYGVHGTPFEIAEYIVQQLPFEDLVPERRRVFEPFAGQAVFLISALTRLRSLLPLDTSTDVAHEYFKRMLVGIEQDAFSLEIARLSLMLADYPNTDGWELLQGDVFTDPRVARELSLSSAVLCNPPFEQFSQQERDSYASLRTAYKSSEILERVLSRPPELIGFVLPRSLLDGRHFAESRRKLIERYQNIDIVTLPDTAFARSQVEPALLTASGLHKGRASIRVSGVDKSDYARFLSTGEPSWTTGRTHHANDSDSSNASWFTQLSGLWKALADREPLGSIARIQRGIEFRIPLKKHRAELVSSTPRPGFYSGLQDIRADFEPYTVRSHVYLNLDPGVMLYKAYQLPWGKPKVLVNAARKARGPWQVVAVPDESGLVASQRFHGIWPTSAPLPIEVLSAILNGPVASAFVSTHRSGRDIQKRTLAQIPIPELSPEQCASLVELVHEYQRTRYLLEYSERDWELNWRCRWLYQEIESITLSAYGLTSTQTEELWQYFGGHRRPLSSINALHRDTYVYSANMRSMPSIEEIGLQVYTPEGFEQFLHTPMEAFGGRTAVELIEEGDDSRVLSALIADYEGLGY